MLAKVAPELFDPDQQEEELRNALIELEKQVETSNQQNRDARFVDSFARSCWIFGLFQSASTDTNCS